MDALVKVRVERLTLDRSTQSPVVVLREEGGERALPIWIGASEASAIHMHLTQVTVGRPLTHDLLVAAIDNLGATLERVSVVRVEQNTYFAEMTLTVAGREVALDARPSDSIAVALRTGSPIFVADDLLEMVQIELTDPDEPIPPPPHGATSASEESSAPEEGMSAQDLQEYLRRLDPEDFGRFKP